MDGRTETSGAQVADDAAAEAALVASWRYDVLRRAGFAEHEALLLARSPADLHDATDLVARGCPTRTAMRILL